MKQFFIGVAATLAVVSAPAAAERVQAAVDGYVFKSEARAPLKMTIYLKRHDSQAALEAEHNVAVERGVAPPVDRGFELRAFAAMNVDDSCTIHIVDPNKSYQPEYLGHELLHCYYGAWH